MVINEVIKTEEELQSFLRSWFKVDKAMDKALIEANLIPDTQYEEKYFLIEYTNKKRKVIEPIHFSQVLGDGKYSGYGCFFEFERIESDEEFETRLAEIYKDPQEMLPFENTMRRGSLWWNICCPQTLPFLTYPLTILEEMNQSELLDWYLNEDNNIQIRYQKLCGQGNDEILKMAVEEYENGDHSKKDVLKRMQQSNLLDEKIKDYFEHNLFKMYPTEEHIEWFEDAFETKYPIYVKDLTPELLLHLDIAVKDFKDEEELEKEWKEQRAERGYSDKDVWSIDAWFINIMPKMLRQLKQEHNGFIPLDKNLKRVPMDFAVEQEEVYNERWEKLLEHMAFLLDELDDDKCSMDNPYEENFWRLNKAFYDRYPDTSVLKTEEEKELEESDGTFIWVLPDRDPEYGEEYLRAQKEYMDYEKKIDAYKKECKDEFFKLFSEYFYDLWD